MEGLFVGLIVQIRFHLLSECLYHYMKQVLIYDRKSYDAIWHYVNDESGSSDYYDILFHKPRFEDIPLKDHESCIQ